MLGPSTLYQNCIKTCSTLLHIHVFNDSVTERDCKNDTDIYEGTETIIDHQVEPVYVSIAIITGLETVTVEYGHFFLKLKKAISEHLNIKQEVKN